MADRPFPSPTGDADRAAPKRIKLGRAKGWRKPADAVIVSRPSRWGNPFRLGEPFRFVNASGQFRMGVVTDRAAAVALFREYVAVRPDMYGRIRDELGGRNLCCWCPLDEPCHADVLMEIANPAPGVADYPEEAPTDV